MPATGSLQLVEAFGERRRWSDEFKAQAVTAALEPGINVSALARRLGISPPQLFGWRKAFLNKQKEDVPAGAPVPLGPATVLCRSFDSIYCNKGDELWAQDERMNFAKTRCELH